MREGTMGEREGERERGRESERGERKVRREEWIERERWRKVNLSDVSSLVWLSSSQPRYIRLSCSPFL